MLMMTPRAPVRVQRSRAHGWRKPAGCIYVGRPTVWGNPFSVAVHGAARATELYRRWVDGNLTTDELNTLQHCLGPHISLITARKWLLARLPELRGQDLCCWCPLTTSDGDHVPCHVDPLLILANR
jgi:hypothetical protein